MTQTEFMGTVDWDQAFAQLKVWPMNRSDEELANQTPRQTYSLWRQLNQWREMFKSVGDAIEGSPSKPRLFA